MLYLKCHDGHMFYMYLVCVTKVKWEKPEPHDFCPWTDTLCITSKSHRKEFWKTSSFHVFLKFIHNSLNELAGNYIQTTS